MKYVIKLCLFCCLLLCLSSCTTTRYVSQEPEWKSLSVGMSHASIVSALGAPDRETTDGRGGKILIYEDYSQTTRGYQANYGYFSVPTSTTTLNTSYLQFFIGSDNICYDVKTNYTEKQQEFSFGKTLLLIGGVVLYFMMLGA